jgi:flagellar basal-body rod modification protein FlgD
MSTTINSSSSNIGAPTSVAGSASSSSSSLGGDSAADLQTTFLKLLVTQLQNQDPTNPMDSSQMTSQLAQISTVQGISNLNTSLSSLATQLNATQQITASGMVGQGVLTAGNTVEVVSGTNSAGTTTTTATPIGIQLPNAATDVTLTIKDSNGNVVRTIDMGAQSAGVHPYEWDGNDSTGTAVAAGNYTFTAAATTGTGTSATTATVTGLSYGQVQAVGANADGSTNLNLTSGKTINLTDVAEII